MAETIRGCLSLTMSGFAFASHDIGGFEGLPPADLYMRWLGFGLFSSHSRLHGSSSYRVPWVYGEEASRVLAKLLNMKHRLMPYLYYHAIRGHTLGHPVQRAMWLEFRDDRTTFHLDQQYMLGPSLLVAPVFVPAGQLSEYYLPEGKWTSLWDSNVLKIGPQWVKEVVSVDELPVWVRPGSVIAIGPDEVGRPDYDFGNEVEVRIYELAVGQEVQIELPSGSGTDIVGQVMASRTEAELHIYLEGSAVKVESLIVFISDFDLGRVNGATCSTLNGELRVVPEAGVSHITLYKI